jgi:tetratricopeptide (TPR) repeat protein
MRTPIALAICVSLAAGSFAETTPEGTAPEWMSVYEKGLAASQRRSYEEALGFYERSWETSRAPGERGASATGIGQTYRHLGRMKEARQWLERAWQEWSADPRQGFSLAVTAGNLADLYRTTGDYRRAERFLREALVSPQCDPESRGLIRNNLADLLREVGRTTEAQSLFKESIDSGSVPWQLRAGALIGLADIDGQKGDWEASIGRWNEVLEICRREKDEKTEAIALRGFAVTWLRSGTAARAEPLLRPLAADDGKQSGHAA